MDLSTAKAIASDPTQLSKLNKSGAAEVLKALTKASRQDWGTVRDMGSPGAAKLYNQYKEAGLRGYPGSSSKLTTNKMKHLIGANMDYLNSGTNTVMSTFRWMDKVEASLSRGGVYIDFSNWTTAKRSKFFEMWNTITNSMDEELLTAWKNLDSNQKAQLITSVLNKRSFNGKMLSGAELADARSTELYNAVIAKAREIKTAHSVGFLG